MYASIYWKWIIMLVVMLLLAGLVAISRQDFIISAGSDALTVIARPPLWTQIVSIFAVCASLYFAITSLKGSRILRWAILLLSFCTYLMGVHAIIFDGKTSRIRDEWAMVDVQSFAFDPVEGLGFDTQYANDKYWVEFHRGKDNVRLFIGIWPWRIDINEIIKVIPSP